LKRCRHILIRTALGSPPARGRGLKPEWVELPLPKRVVAPRTGAWIETRRESPQTVGPSVAPRTGAWIETWPIWMRRVKSTTGRPPHGGVD